ELDRRAEHLLTASFASIRNRHHRAATRWRDPVIQHWRSRAQGGIGWPDLRPAMTTWATCSLRQQFAADDDLLDVAGAFVDFTHAHIAIDALDQEILEEAVAAMDLDRVGADALGHLGG